MTAERHPDVNADRLLDLACEALPPGEAREVEAHAAGCAACREALARMRATRRTMAALGPEPAPARGEAALLAAAGAQGARNAARRRRRLAMWLAPTAAAAGLAVAVSWQVMGGRPEVPGRGDPEALAVRSAPAPAADVPPPGAAREESSRTYATPPPASAPAVASAPPSGAAPSPADSGAPSPAPEAPPERVAPPPAFEPAPATRAAPAPAPPEPGAAPPAASSERRAAKASRAAAPELAPSASRADEPAPAPRAAWEAELRAGASDAAGAAEDAEAAARARYAGLRASGQLRGEIRTLPGCEGEAWRKVELDPEGRVVSYVREGRVAGRRLRVEHLFDASGALVAATAFDLETPGPGQPARALGLDVPLRAEDAGPDAPPRCGR